MKVLRLGSKDETALREVEDVLLKHKMQIDWNYGITVTIDGREYKLMDIESGETVQGLPRMVDSERLTVED